MIKRTDDVDRRVVLAGLTALPLAGFSFAKNLHAAPDEGRSCLAYDGDRLLLARGTIRASQDFGRSWRELGAPAPIAALATHPGRPGRIVVGLASGGVAISEDGGSTWRDASNGLPAGEAGAIAIAAHNPELMYTAVFGDGLWKSENAGKSWTLAMDRPWLEGAERDPLALASVALDTGMGGIWIYAGTEAGLTRVPDCFCRWQDVRPGNAMDALASGSAPPPEAPLPKGDPVLSLASAATSPGTLHAATQSGTWASEDGGVVWRRTMAGTARRVAIHPFDHRRIAAVIGDMLQLSRDGGTTWKAGGPA